VDLRYAGEHFFAFDKGGLEGATLESLYFLIELENSAVDVDHRLNHILRRRQDLRNRRAESNGGEEKEGK